MADPSPSSNKAISVLFVCLGNICRSPMAQGTFQHVLSSRPSTSSPAFATIDSAGTAAYHTGSSPDPRTMSVLKKHGITSYTHSARKVRNQDFDDFDYLFAMDGENLEDLQDMRKHLAQQRKKSRPAGEAGGDKDLARVMLFGAFGGKSRSEEVIDPYYGGGEGFDIAFEQMQRFSKGFLRFLEEGSSSS